MKRPGKLSFILFLALVPLVIAYFTVGTDDPVEPASQPATPDVEPRPSLSTESVPNTELDADFMQVLQEGLPTPGCEDFREPAPDTRTTEQTSNELRSAANSLSGANDPNLVLASALLTEDKDERLRRLTDARSLDPNSKLAIWHLVQECSGKSCGGQELLDEAARVDGDNSAIWLERARASLKNEDWDAAEVELRQGIAAPRYDIYFVDQVVLLQEALAASSNLNYQERSFAAFGIAAAIAVPQYGDITKACASDGNNASIWSPICDEYGEVMSERGSTLLDRGVGLALRRIAAKRAGNQSAAARFRRERESMSALMNEMAMTGAHALAENDPAFQMDYIDHLVTYGELAAMKYSIDEAKRLRADPTYNQCNFVLRREQNP